MKKTFEEVMNSSIQKLMEYFQEFKQGNKPLGEKVQVKCRAFMHKNLAEFASWLTVKGIEWKENSTPLDEVSENIEKTLSRLGPALYTKTQNQIEKWRTGLIQKGKYDAADRLPDTMAESAEKVAKTDLSAAISFSTKTTAKTKTVKEKALTA